MDIRTCDYCKTSKPVNEFISKFMCLCCRSIRNKEAAKRQSKEEIREYNKNYYENNKENILAQKKVYRKNNKDRLRESDRKRNKHYYANNKERVLYSRKKYYEKNKQKKKEYDKKYYRLNKKKRMAQSAANNKRRRKEDLVYRLRQIISTSIGKFLKNANSSKNGSSILKHLPYTIEELKQHLEKQFEPWMNWNNYGVYRIDLWKDDDQSTWAWRIDHIIPHSNFKYTSMEDQEFKDCWALSNLRPYSAKRNIIDGDRIKN